MIGNLGDYTTSETIYVPFNTFDSDGASVTLTGLAVTDIEIYKNGSPTQRSSDAGYALLDTDGIDFDGTTGIHGFSIDLSDDTDSGFYSNGDQFWIIVSAITVDSQTVSFVAGIFTIGRLLRPVTAGNQMLVDASGQVTVVAMKAAALADLFEVDSGKTFAGDAIAGSVVKEIADNVDVRAISGDTGAADNLELQFDGTGIVGDGFPSRQDQVGLLTNVGSNPNFLAESYVLTTGTQSSGTFTDTFAVDSAHHEHTDDAGALELYYEFNVTGAGNPVSVEILGRLNGANDDLDGVFAFDWVAAAWVRLGDFDGQGSSTDQVRAFNLFTRNVGTGSEIGKVRIRFFAASGLTTSTLLIDQIFVSATLTSAGADKIFVDTNASNTNTVPGVDGVPGNPVSTWAAALTLAAKKNVFNFDIANGSSFALTANSDAYTIEGHGWFLDLAGQSIDGAFIAGAEVDGVFVGNPTMFFCTLVDIVGSQGVFERCGHKSSVTVNGAGNWFFHDGFSLVAGTGIPVIDFGASAGTSNMNIRLASSGLEVKNMGQAGTDELICEGFGLMIINASCIGGTVTCRGMMEQEDNSGGKVVLVDDARFTRSETAEEFWRQSEIGERGDRC